MSDEKPADPPVIPPHRAVLTLVVIATDTPPPSEGEPGSTRLEPVGTMSAANTQELLAAVRLMGDWAKSTEGKVIEAMRQRTNVARPGRKPSGPGESGIVGVR
jgi:hypothetical protein